MNKRAMVVLTGGILAATVAVAQPGGPGQGSQQGQQGQQAGRGYRGGGYGHGMMGGDYGGMMGGGYGGMMGGFGWSNIPDLTQDQRTRITSIRRDLRNKQFTLMDQMHDQWASTNYYRNGQFDEQAARRAYDASEKIHRQMFENMLDAHKRMDAVLTPAQRQQLGRSAGGQQ